MKKTLAIILALCLGASMLAACGGSRLRRFRLQRSGFRVRGRKHRLLRPRSKAC